MQEEDGARLELDSHFEQAAHESVPVLLQTLRDGRFEWEGFWKIKDEETSILRQKLGRVAAAILRHITMGAPPPLSPRGL